MPRGVRPHHRHRRDNGRRYSSYRLQTKKKIPNWHGYLAMLAYQNSNHVEFCYGCDHSRMKNSHGYDYARV
jgi:hypothetical protein